jgi:hypothetical protein
MRRLRVPLLVLLFCIGAAIAVDRVALVTWRARVERYAHELERAAESPPARASLANLLVTTRDGGPWRVPLLEIRVKGPKPSRVTVDGNGGLNLLYEPPSLAWSRHIGLAQRRPVVQGSDSYSYNDVYVLKIWTVQARPGGLVLDRPTVTLEHGLPF